MKLKDFVGTDRNIFFKAMYGFDPEEWGGVNFRSVDSFLKKSQNSDLIAVYVTRNACDARGKPQKDCGKIAGFYEISRRKLALKDCISAVKQQQFKNEIESGKWGNCLKATKAWEIIAEDKKRAEDILPETYNRKRAQSLSSSGVRLTDKEISRLLELRVTEKAVYSRCYESGDTGSGQSKNFG